MNVNSMVLFIKNILCMCIQEILIIAVQCNCSWVAWAHINKSGWKLGLESTLWEPLLVWNWEGRKQRRNLARKVEKRCWTGSLDGSSAKIISLVFRVRKWESRQMFGQKKEPKAVDAWRFTSFFLPVPRGCNNADIWYSLAFTAVQPQPELCYCRRGWSLSLPKITFYSKNSHIMDYIAKHTCMSSDFWALQGCSIPMKISRGITSDGFDLISKLISSLNFGGNRQTDLIPVM